MRQRTRTRAVVLPLLICVPACTGDGSGGDDGLSTDSAADGGAATAFASETTLAHPSIDEDEGTCTIGYYWPALSAASPLFVVPYEAPGLPYEIRSLSVTVFSLASGAFQGRSCDASYDLRLFAYVSAEDAPTTSTQGDESWPTITAIAEVTVSGAGDGTDWEDIEELTGVIDPPVLVEDEGLLWIGYEVVQEDEETITCPMGCADEHQGWAYLPPDNDWGEEAGWSVNEWSPDVRVTIGHD